MWVIELVQSTNVSTLATYQSWQSFKFILLTVKVIIFIRRKRKIWGKFGEIHLNSTMLYKFIRKADIRISNALLRSMTTTKMSPKCPLRDSKIALNHNQACVITAVPSVQLAACRLISYIIWLFHIPLSWAAWHWKSAALPGSWQRLW